MSNQFILTRTLTSREGDVVEWQNIVTNDSANRAAGGLSRNGLLPQDVDQASVEVTAGPFGGRFDADAGSWSFTLDPGEKAMMSLRGTVTDPSASTR